VIREETSIELVELLVEPGELRVVSIELEPVAPVELVELPVAPNVPVPDAELVFRSCELDELLGEVEDDELLPGVLLAIAELVSLERDVPVEPVLPVDDDPVPLVEPVPVIEPEPDAPVVSVGELVEPGLLELVLLLGLDDAVLPELELGLDEALP